ncbi:MAG: hypothetical protein WCP39_04770 [Chlamydiota bacterium]
MKDPTHHRKKFIKKILHAPQEGLPEEFSNEVFRHELTQRQKKKQAKAHMKWERDHHIPIHPSEEERNRILKKRGDVRDYKKQGSVPKNIARS